MRSKTHGIITLRQAEAKSAESVWDLEIDRLKKKKEKKEGREGGRETSAIPQRYLARFFRVSERNNAAAV